jgi:hypothetical protein
MTMQAEPARPGPVECVQRGLRSLLANWQLLPLVVAQTLLTTGLVLAGFFILLAGLGVGIIARLRDLGPSGLQRLVEEMATALEAGPPALLPLVPPLIAATLVWTLAFGLYCYLQGGVVGVLAEAEMAAGAGRPGWRSFRRFSLAGFDLLGRRLFWRYFWFYNLVGAVGLAWLVLALGLLVLAAGLATAARVSAGVAIGCLGLAPLGLLLLTMALWSMLATVEMARPGAGVGAASRRALGILRRRLGPVLAICLLALVGWLAVGAAFAPLEWAVAVAAGDRLAVWLGGHGALMLAESLTNAALVVALIATLAALVGLRPAGAAEAAS